MLIRYLLFLLLGIPHSVSAQQDELLRQALQRMYGTVLTQHHWLRRQGELTGCSIEYRLLIQDWAYSQGRPVVVTGAIGLHTNDRAGAVVGLKVVALDQHRQGGNVVSVPNAPHFAYLENASNVNNADAMVGSDAGDTPGGRVFAFNFFADSQIEITKSIMDNKIRLLFNRKEGGGDIRVPIDLTVLDTGDDGARKHGMETLEQFRQCASEFLSQVQAKMERSSRK